MSRETITLKDSTSGATASIVPGIGFNCCSCKLAQGDELVEVLWAHRDFTSGKELPAHSGIPLLFPFAGRITGTSLRYGGRDYPLEEGDGRGNAIHGFVLGRAWRVLEASPRHAVGQFQASVDDPSLVACWPADFRITVRYELQSDILSCHVRIENPDSRALPFGFGTHPYFRVPLGQKGSGEACVITVPVSRSWELEDLCPTGRVGPAAVCSELSEGLRLEGRELDAVFTGLTFEAGRCVTQVYDPVNARTVTQKFDATFQHCVIYAPPHREAVCIEPYTCAPDAFQLETQGLDTGLRRLGPGESCEMRIEISLGFTQSQHASQG